MNKVFLKGNLTRDPEVKEITVGGNRSATVANFTLAVSRYYKKTSGETEQVTEFIDCEAWDSGAVTMGKILSKGDPVLLEGSLKKESWEKDGQKFSRVKVRVSNFDKLARFVKSESENSQEPEVVAVGDGEDIDF